MAMVSSRGILRMRVMCQLLGGGARETREGGKEEEEVGMKEGGWELKEEGADRKGGEQMERRNKGLGSKRKNSKEERGDGKEEEGDVYSPRIILPRPRRNLHAHPPLPKHGESCVDDFEREAGAGGDGGAVRVCAGVGGAVEELVEEPALAYVDWRGGEGS